ncbi:MAG: DUF5694 domain-containing protein [Mycobacterium leprae]
MIANEAARILGLGERAKVMLLGTFHFANPGLDALNLQVDMTTPQRQAEIAAVVDRLAAFAPTKIAVEAPLDAEERVNQRYHAYRSGASPLTANEIQQLGFRLAARLGHDKLYPIDAWGRFYESEEQMTAYIQSRGYTEENFHRLLHDPKWWERYTALFRHDAQLQASHTLMEYLAYINSPERVRLDHGLYLAWPDGEPGDYWMADYISGWWINRNLRIFANLKRLTTSPADRILVIYGAGHLSLLRHAVESSYLHELVEVGEYLCEKELPPHA